MARTKKNSVPVNEPKTEEEIAQATKDTQLMNLSYDQWDEILRDMVSVYKIDSSQYLAKRYDHIEYRLVPKEEAGKILVENANFILKNYFFHVHSDEVYDRINDITKRYEKDPASYIKNYDYKSFKPGGNEKFHLYDISSSCVAFNNGVFDFKKNDWLFKYSVETVEVLNQRIIKYNDNRYVVYWFFNINFEPYPFSIYDMTIDDFRQLVRDTYKDDEVPMFKNNLCFGLVWNMSHDADGKFSNEMFMHLCMIMGYMIYQPFADKFIMLIGNGQNGKNSLFDSCLKGCIMPQPSGVSLDSIEEDQFVTESLINKYQNLYLESDAKEYLTDTNLKNITGSQYQTINQKGVSKYDAIINCKHMFSANNRDMVKFADSTHGFERRINMFELYYQWDAHGDYMKSGDQDWYETRFSSDLHEITDNPWNIIMYVYLAMYGIKEATADFTKQFDFGTHNDWDAKQYLNFSTTILERINSNLTYDNIYDWIKTIQGYQKNRSTIEKSILCNKESIFKFAGYQTSSYFGHGLYSEFFNDLGDSSYNSTGEYETNDLFNAYYNPSNEILLSVKCLKAVIHELMDDSKFIDELKKIYGAKSVRKEKNGMYYIGITVNPNNRGIIVNGNKH